MLFDPYCFIQYIERNNGDIVEYTDNWTDGNPIIHLFEDLPVSMSECIHIEVAKMYLDKINAKHLIDSLKNLDCPCNNYSST
jgi:hypothetical protein